MSPTPRFKSVALDVDSTLCGIEGIDWLASLRDEDVARRVAHATDIAMKGQVALEDLYGDRMELVSPSRAEVEALTGAYRSSLSAGARESIAEWRAAGVEVVLVSGGLRAAIVPLARELGFDDTDVNALDISFDSDGRFAGFDRSSPLATATGKRKLLEMLPLARPLLAVGDGITDLAMRDVADAFVAFTGFAARDAVTSRADYVAGTFDELTRIIFDL